MDKLFIYLHVLSWILAIYFTLRALYVGARSYHINSDKLVQVLAPTYNKKKELLGIDLNWERPIKFAILCWIWIIVDWWNK